jgi:hypothetical protein
VRIDRSDPADGPGDAHIARRAQPAPDDPDGTGKDSGKAVGDYGPPDSSPAHQASALQVDGPWLTAPWSMPNIGSTTSTMRPPV